MGQQMAKHHETTAPTASTRPTANEPAETETRLRQVAARARSRTSPFAILLGVLACFTGLAPTNAYAYLDPGTGTFALQGLIAGIAGGVLGLRAYWRRIGKLFRRAKAASEAWPEQPLSGGDA
jgi:hypothetical protein